MSKKKPSAKQWVSIHTDPPRPVPDVFEVRRYGDADDNMRLRHDANNQDDKEGLVRLLFGGDADAEGGVAYMTMTPHEYREVYDGLVELDKPMNAHFVRDGRSLWGWYERDGRRSTSKVPQWVNDYDIWCPCPITPWLPEFIAWYDAQGWTRESWWERRSRRAR